MCGTTLSPPHFYHDATEATTCAAKMEIGRIKEDENPKRAKFR